MQYYCSAEQVQIPSQRLPLTNRHLLGFEVPHSCAVHGQLQELVGHWRAIVAGVYPPLKAGYQSPELGCRQGPGRRLARHGNSLAGGLSFGPPGAEVPELVDGLNASSSEGQENTSCALDSAPWGGEQAGRHGLTCQARHVRLGADRESNWAGSCHPLRFKPGSLEGSLVSAAPDLVREECQQTADAWSLGSESSPIELREF
jgi:hypothetical protein